MARKPLSAWVALGQGIYYLITGIWPIISRRTFELVTGPKYDFWLVRTFGALISVVGVVLAWAGLREKVTPEVAALGVGSALSLGGSDVIYASQRRIRRIYGVEALAELALIIIWWVGLRADSKSRRASVLQFSPEI